MFKIDNVEYDGVKCAVSGLTESISFVKGESDRTLLNGDRWTNTIGLRRSHTVTLTRDPSLSNSAWEDLWNNLKELRGEYGNVHTFEFPNGLDSIITYEGEVKDLSRDLICVETDQNGNDIYIWGDYSLSVEGMNRMDN